MNKYKYNYFPRDRFYTRYTPEDFTNQVFVTGKEDVSPQWPHWNMDHYDPDCSACWLGINHSTDYHNKDA